MALVTDHPAQGAVSRWVEDAVIGENLCPFAQREWLAHRVRLCVSDAGDLDTVLSDLMDELNRIDQSDALETTLVILGEGGGDFDEYLDWLEASNLLVFKMGLEGKFQLASFHPEYQFEGEAFEDASNFTNRAPWPVLHILREESIEAALASVDDPDAIFERNQAHARARGTAYWQSLLARSHGTS
ncbi:DUF1415 domain-containing protein [Larsenimonas salina]|uniref:DUF1415 domain-containing protein n=1 Tax=Larsenimonas salina TaxID=1295565 RepID=UPI00207404A8|nr:DUF1415 domain-containing protein [Larsenimonas salina]MCM5703823.1 DUF1415 domain-containing protein [Larsenimonas salina]